MPDFNPSSCDEKRQEGNKEPLHDRVIPKQQWDRIATQGDMDWGPIWISHTQKETSKGRCRQQQRRYCRKQLEMDESRIDQIAAGLKSECHEVLPHYGPKRVAGQNVGFPKPKIVSVVEPVHLPHIVTG